MAKTELEVIEEETLTVGKWLAGPYRKRIENVLPKILNAERMITVCVDALRKNPKLLQCNRDSLFASMLRSIQLGLECNGTLGQAYLVPFKDECTLIVGYQGMLEVCRRSDQIVTVVSEVVYSNDDFDYQRGDSPHVHHKPAWVDDAGEPMERGNPLGAYTSVMLKDGSRQSEVMSKADIMKHKEMSPAKNKKDSPWNHPHNWVWMWKKTTILQAAKLLPKSIEDVRRLVFEQEQAEAGLPQQLEDSIDLRVEDYTASPAVEEAFHAARFSQGKRKAFIGMAKAEKLSDEELIVRIKAQLDEGEDRPDGVEVPTDAPEESAPKESAPKTPGKQEALQELI